MKKEQMGHAVSYGMKVEWLKCARKRYTDEIANADTTTNNPETYSELTRL